jgi:glycosyltransferase involved in cell wall biosynthesis
MLTARTPTGPQRTMDKRPEIMPTDSIVEDPRSTAQRRTEVGRLKRVLFVLRLDPAGKFGSIEEQALTLARSFRDRGSLFLPVFLRPLDSESARQYAQEGLGFEALDLSQFRLGALRHLIGLIRRHRIEVVHWNFYHLLFNGYLWALTTLKPGGEHYFTDHISRPATGPGPDSRGRLKSRLKRILAARYRKILCVSDYVLARVREAAGPQAERIPHFINTDRFRPDPSVRRAVRQALGVREEFVALVVAYLIKDKGIDVAIRALSELPQDVVLWVVGEGPEQGNLQALARDLSLGHRVQFLGPRRHVEPLMQAADCALCPSVWAEAAGLVNLEALGCGLPVVASRVGGIPEIIEDGRTGFLFTPGDPRGLADRISRLLGDEQTRQRMSQQARSVALERFSTQSQIDEYLNLYAAEARIDRTVQPAPAVFNRTIP